ncbi:MAG TPA: hypothetical protein VHQ95_09105 [Pyrinomonadaceae bacterium]|jgi:hypothetical protein|nr:hypothetical protein [Pyrinomonadaceae bacterium]
MSTGIGLLTDAASPECRLMWTPSRTRARSDTALTDKSKYGDYVGTATEAEPEEMGAEK